MTSLRRGPYTIRVAWIYLGLISCFKKAPIIAVERFVLIVKVY
jgi:hypothetical protein